MILCKIKSYEYGKLLQIVKRQLWDYTVVSIVKNMINVNVLNILCDICSMCFLNTF